MSETSQVDVLFSDLNFLPWSSVDLRVPFQRWKRPCVLRQVCRRECDDQKVERYKCHSKALIRLALLDASQLETMAGQKRPENARSESVM